jgi:hypothetical protein
MFELHPKPQRVLILTDGEVGAPMIEHVERIRDERIKLHVVLPAGARLHDEVEAMATSVVYLPPLRY